MRSKNRGREASYYSAGLHSAPAFAQLTEDIHAEVCIIGAGYAGLMTQLGLLQRGCRSVVVLEESSIASGASGRNGGFVFGGYSLSPQALYAIAGADEARALYQLSLDAVELIRRRVSAFNIDCELVEEGALLVNWFTSQKILHRQQCDMHKMYGVEWDYIAPGDLREKINSERYCGALYESRAMHFNPLKYAQGIAEKNRALGGLLFTDSKVKMMQSSSGEHILTLANNKRVHCKHVVVCAGAYIGNSFPKVARAIVPIATYIAVTEPLSDNCANSMFSRAAVYDNRFAFDYYRPLNDGRLLWGGRISANTRRPANLARLLRRDMIRVFPQLSKVGIDYAWSGLMAYPRHQMPCIGELGRGFWYNIGFGGHGVGPTTVGAELIASAISQKDDRYRMFDRWGLPYKYGVLGSCAAQASYYYYQARDWLADTCGY